MKNNEKILEKLNYIIESLETFKMIIKDIKPVVQKKDIKKAVLKKYRPKDFARDKILRNARKKAHTVVANMKRRISGRLREIRG